MSNEANWFSMCGDGITAHLTVTADDIRNGAQWKNTGRHWMQAEFSQQ